MRLLSQLPDRYGMAPQRRDRRFAPGVARQATKVECARAAAAVKLSSRLATACHPLVPLSIGPAHKARTPPSAFTPRCLVRHSADGTVVMTAFTTP